MADEIKNNVKSGIDTVANAAKKVTDKTDDVINRVTNVNLRETGQAVMDKAGQYAHQAREKVGEWAGEAKEAVGDLAEHASEKAQQWAGEAYHVAADNVSSFGNEVTQLVRKHPLPAILIGFGLGLLLGRVVRSV